MKEIISVVLITEDQEFEQAALSLSADLKDHGSLIALGPSWLTHLTVAQFEAPESALPDLYEATKSLQGERWQLTAAGLSFTPSSNGGTWVEIAFLKSRALQKLQAYITSSEFAARFSVFSGQGDLYRPHVTVGLLPGLTVPAMDLEKFKSIPKSTYSFRIGIGVNGENFTFSKEFIPE